MKNILNYYYGIIVSKIDGKGYFNYYNHLFCLYQIKRNIHEIEILVSLNYFMLERKMLINKIILNNYMKPITSYNGKNYVLIEINYNREEIIFPFILAPLDKRFDFLKRNNWATLWSIKVDYFEENIQNIEKKRVIIHDTIDYYIGLSENAISYFKMLNLNNEKLYISHRRINDNDIYNPLEIVFDYKVRDLSEYIKYAFFVEKKNISEIKKIIQRIDLGYVDYLLLYTRLLYPSYYFDLLDMVMEDDIKEKRLEEIVLLSTIYEELLFEIYLLIKRKYPIIGIEWLNKEN